MGNCLNAASKQQDPRRRRGERVVPEERDQESIADVLLQEQEEDEQVPATQSAAGMKVKVVLTRAELEWLMAQLKSGDQRLEDVLRQVSTARTGATADSKPTPRADGWRPRLERILECPEPAVDAT
ncbi:uncharacterized protein LOC124683583 [Lolium rigidum]|uniref:uncharacterized protein LOC124683583 n=1 Tax=Lolium rigidum TaxID=89674 RepID=UPI001F5C1E8A|nr:uncharacterized protein LOC124683583 [Lolium rigidum]